MYGYACMWWCSQIVLSEVCHPGHVQDTSQGLPELFSFNWVDQWMMIRLNGFNLGGSSQMQCYVKGWVILALPHLLVWRSSRASCWLLVADSQYVYHRCCFWNQTAHWYHCPRIFSGPFVELVLNFTWQKASWLFQMVAWKCQVGAWKAPDVLVQRATACFSLHRFIHPGS